MLSSLDLRMHQLEREDMISGGYLNRLTILEAVVQALWCAMACRAMMFLLF